ncbi:MAG: Type 1 glutamine amidotransferase-like domain-containing protein [Clostridia bacterium]|nr:Type 1 glutamine amidotransferase-like domain-containing protein [Clostridia bacterium]
MQFFFGGGNTYKLLFELKLGGCIEKIKEYIKNDGVVFGGSAGAIIMGYDIKSSECEDENNVGLVNTKGLDILNGIAIFCHYTNREADKNEINKIFLTNTSNEIKIVALPEEDTIYVHNEGIEVYGNKPYYIFDKGSINIIEKEKDRN